MDHRVRRLPLQPVGGLAALLLAALSLAACGGVSSPAPIPSGAAPTPAPGSTPPPAVSCSAGQYVNEAFASATVMRDVLFSTVTDAYGTHPLRMDVYSGLGDAATNRPAMVWAFGGNFETGRKTQLANFATAFALRGYVTVAIEYRTLRQYAQLPGPVVQDAAQSDAQAAIRYLRARARELGIDPARIGIAGWSAGSITAFNVGYNYEYLGDNTANPGQPHSVAAVLGLDGFLMNAELMQANDPPFILFRAGRGSSPDGDPGFPPLIARASAMQITFEVHEVAGARHNDLPDPPYDQQIVAVAAPFLRRTLAGCR